MHSIDSNHTITTKNVTIPLRTDEPFVIKHDKSNSVEIIPTRVVIESVASDHHSELYITLTGRATHFDHTIYRYKKIETEINLSSEKSDGHQISFYSLPGWIRESIANHLATDFDVVVP